jgi:hypothetical protein
MAKRLTIPKIRPKKPIICAGCGKQKLVRKDSKSEMCNRCAGRLGGKTRQENRRAMEDKNEPREL